MVRWPLSGPFTPSRTEVEQLTLHEFLDYNLANHFIHPLQSVSGTPILFIKDSSLRLAVDYLGLNWITENQLQMSEF